MDTIVTGGTGFIGGNVVRALLDDGLSVRILVRPSSDTRNIDGLDVELVQGDVRDSTSLKQAVRGCKYVFHTAALYSFWAKKAEIYEVNVQGTRNVLEAAKHAGAERIVYTSSVAALSVSKNRRPVTEDMPINPQAIVGAYKRSKYEAEQVALGYARDGLPVIIVNPSFPVGSRDIKPTPTGRVILDFLRGNMPAYVETGMNVVDVEDVAIGHLQAAKKGRCGERYILGGKNMTMNQLLVILSEITGKPAPKVKLPYMPVLALAYVNKAICQLRGTTPRMTPDTVRMSKHYMYYDPSKAIEELELPQTRPEVAIAKAVKWFEDNGYVGD